MSKRKRPSAAAQETLRKLFLAQEQTPEQPARPLPTGDELPPMLQEASGPFDTTEKTDDEQLTEETEAATPPVRRK